MLLISETFFALYFMIFRLVAVNESLTTIELHFLFAFINQSATLKCFFGWLAHALPLLRLSAEQFFIFIHFPQC